MKGSRAAQSLLGCAAMAAAGLATAQTQVVKPPVSQAWIDVATFAGMGMPAMGGAVVGAASR